MNMRFKVVEIKSVKDEQWGDTLEYQHIRRFILRFGSEVVTLSNLNPLLEYYWYQDIEMMLATRLTSISRGLNVWQIQVNPAETLYILIFRP